MAESSNNKHLTRILHTRTLVWTVRCEQDVTCLSGYWILNNSHHVRLEVPMMRGQLELPLGYSLSLEARILELPLSRRRMSLFLILPDYLTPGIQQLEANLTTHHIKALMSTLKVSSSRDSSKSLI